MNRLKIIILVSVFSFVFLSSIEISAVEANGLVILNRIFKTVELKNLSEIYYKLDKTIEINREFVKKLNPEIKKLYKSELVLDGKEFYEIFSDKLNFNEIRSGCKGLIVLAEFYRRDKKHKVTIKILKHIIAFSIAMARDSINYGEDGTGTLMQYMISLAVSNIAMDYTAGMIYTDKISQKDYEKLSVYLEKSEKYFPDFSGSIKSEEHIFADFMKKTKKHKTGIYTLIREMNELGNSPKTENPMDVALLKTLEKSEDARYVYDLYMDDALSEMKNVCSIIYRTKNKNYIDLEETFLELDQKLCNGKIGKNFLCLLAIPNFKRAKEIEIGFRAKLRILYQVTSFLSEGTDLSALQKNVNSKGVKDPWNGKDLICYSNNDVSFLGCGFKDLEEMKKYIPQKNSKTFHRKKLESWQCIFSFKDGFVK